MPDFVLNGQGHGSVAATLMAHDFDPNCLRPWVAGDDDQYQFISVNSGKRDEDRNLIYEPRLVANANASLRKDEWIMMDQTVQEVAQSEMRLFGDLRGAGSVLTIPNGMGKTVAEYQRESDITPAEVSMDGIKQADADAPVFDLAGTPLPIIHKDFYFTARQLSTSRQSGQPLDQSMVRLSTRQVIEEVERMTVGSSTFTYAGYSIYGYTNFPQRLTQTLTAPTSANHGTTVAEVLSMRKKSIDKNYRGPWILYCSPAWDAYLDEDYSTTKGSNTLRERLTQIRGINAVETAYFLPDTTMVLVQITPEVAQAVVGMDVTVVQWESMGGMQINFKVMAIMVPRLKADFAGQTGLVHGSV